LELVMIDERTVTRIDNLGDRALIVYEDGSSSGRKVIDVSEYRAGKWVKLPIPAGHVGNDPA
jgi:hypothetical protein